jgi:TIR domain
MLQSLFISYGVPDEAQVRRINDALKAHGVTTWFFADDAIPGTPLHRAMRDGVNQHDRVLLICSKASLSRTGVRNEIEEVLRRQAREAGQARLIPITIDDYAFTDWKNDNPDAAQPVLDLIVADFRGADTDAAKFDAGVRKLIAALNK